MRRLVLSLAVALAVVPTAVGPAVAPAAASPSAAEPTTPGLPPGLTGLVTGPATGTTMWELGDGCPFVHQTFDGTYGAPWRRFGHFQLDVCADPDPGVAGGFRYTGSFVLRTRTGASVTGTVDGGVFPLDVVLAVTGGTGPFAHVTASLTLRGTWTATVPGAGRVDGVLAAG